MNNVKSFVLVKPEVGDTGGHALGIAACLVAKGMPAGGVIEAKETHVPENGRLFEVLGSYIGRVLRAVDFLQHEHPLLQVMLQP